MIVCNPSISEKSMAVMNYANDYPERLLSFLVFSEMFTAECAKFYNRESDSLRRTVTVGDHNGRNSEHGGSRILGLYCRHNHI